MTAKNTTPSTSFAALATKLEAFGKSLPDAERELLGRLVSTSPLRSELTDGSSDRRRVARAIPGAASSPLAGSGRGAPQPLRRGALW